MEKTFHDLLHLPWEIRLPILFRLSLPFGIKTKRGGEGELFYSLRPYLPSDPKKKIAFRQSAKRGIWLVREMDSPQSLRILIEIDLTPSMEYPPGEENKKSWGIALSLVVAHTALATGHTVDIVQGGVPERVTRKDSLLPLFFTFLNDQTTLFPVFPEGRYDLYILVGDLLDPTLLERVAERKRFPISKKGSIRFLEILHPHELDIPFHKPVQFIDPEQTVWIREGERENLWEEYEKNFSSYRGKIHQLLEEKGIEKGIYLVGEDPISALHFLHEGNFSSR